MTLRITNCEGREGSRIGQEEVELKPSLNGGFGQYHRALSWDVLQSYYKLQYKGLKTLVHQLLSKADFGQDGCLQPRQFL